MMRSACQPTIDLNADFGESATPEYLAIADVVIGSVTSVNIACGGHAGDEVSMRHAIQKAAHHGVVVGAHPSYPDRMNFGRTRMGLASAALRATIGEQIAALAAVARSEGVSLGHCKPHGTLYHAASVDESVAIAIHRACTDIDPGLRLVGQAGSQAVAWWRAWGAAVSEEAFADRVYDSNGSLRPRTMPNAVITDPDAAAEQAKQIVTTRTVRCPGGVVLPLEADTLCIHADTLNAGVIAARIAEALIAAGVTLSSIA